MKMILSNAIEAIKLNEPNFGPNQLSGRIIGSLGSLYERTNLQKTEQLYETYELCVVLKAAERKTPDLTDDDMDRIEAERAKKFGR